MAEIFSLRPSEHDAVQELLPWYVTGTLTPAESERVEGHLADCEACREDLAFERKLADGVASLPLNADDGWQAMKLRMAEEPPPARPNGAVRLLRRRVPLAWAMVGSLAASVALAVVLTGVRPTATPAPQPTYHTLGSTAADAQGQVVVLFRPDTTEQQMRVVLEAQDARLVDGPTAAGAYVLHFDSGKPEDAIKALRQSSEVVLAEPLTNDGRP
jgi:anti-sigma factor RsiW